MPLFHPDSAALSIVLIRHQRRKPLTQTQHVLVGAGAGEGEGDGLGGGGLRRRVVGSGREMGQAATHAVTSQHVTQRSAAQYSSAHPEQTKQADSKTPRSPHLGSGGASKR